MAKTQSIDYTSKDYAGFLASMISYAQANFPEWSGASEGDIAVMLMEAQATAMDTLSYYQDRLMTEAYMSTATQRRSILNLASMYGYIPASPIPATGTITLVTDSTAPDTTIPAGTQISTDFVESLDAPIIFETTSTVIVPGSGGTLDVSIRQGQTITDEVIATSTGLAGQVYRLYNTPVIQGSITVNVGNTDGVDHYVNIDNLLDAGPTDQVFSATTDENAVTWIVFGDGVNGIVPPATEQVYATYRVGGGSAGNVAVSSVTNIVSHIDGVSILPPAVGSTQFMQGGADAETNDEIRVNATRTFQTQQRCVTQDDYASMALAQPSVAKAVAVGSTYSNITVFVAGRGATRLDETTINRVQQAIQAKAQVGTIITVTPAQAVPVNVSLNLFVTDRYSQQQVKADVVTALQTYLGFGQQEFGQRVPLSAIYRTIDKVSGVDYCAVNSLVRADAGVQNIAGDIVVRDWELPTYGAITITSVDGGIDEAASIAL